jgi:hypothetical protein
MWIRKLVIVAVLACAPSAAHAEVGLGVFLGEPTGIDFKLGLSHKTALDILVGVYNHWDRWSDDGTYAHVTYLVQPLVTHGDSVIVPLRIGIGGAVFDDVGRYDGDIHLAVRVPFELAIQFRRSPVEIYGEQSDDRRSGRRSSVHRSRRWHRHQVLLLR